MFSRIWVREFVFLLEEGEETNPIISSSSHPKTNMKRLTNKDFTQSSRDPCVFTSNERIVIPAGSKWMIIRHPYIDVFNSLNRKVTSFMYISCKSATPRVIIIDNIYSPGTWELELFAECKDDREEKLNVSITHPRESGVTTPINWEFSYSFSAQRVEHSSPSPMKKVTNKDFSTCGDHSLLSNRIIHVPKGVTSVTVTDLDMKAINISRPELGPCVHIQMRIGEDEVGTFSFALGSSGTPNYTSKTITTKYPDLKNGRMELTISTSPGGKCEIVGDWEFSYGFIGLLDIPGDEKSTEVELSSKDDSTQSMRKERKITSISRSVISSSIFLTGLAGALISSVKRSSTGLLVSGGIMCVSSIIILL